MPQRPTRGPSVTCFFPTAFGRFFFAPLVAYCVEENTRRRPLLAGLTVAGFLMGLLIYVPLVTQQDWFKPIIVHMHLDYSTVTILGAVPTRALYALIVVLAPAISSRPQIRLLGLFTAVSIAFTFAFWSYAFISVWCFFAALLSVSNVRLLRSLPDKRVSPELPGRGHDRDSGSLEGCVVRASIGRMNGCSAERARRSQVDESPAMRTSASLWQFSGTQIRRSSYLRARCLGVRCREHSSRVVSRKPPVRMTLALPAPVLCQLDLALDGTPSGQPTIDQLPKLMPWNAEALRRPLLPRGKARNRSECRRAAGLQSLEP